MLQAVTGETQKSIWNYDAQLDATHSEEDSASCFKLSQQQLKLAQQRCGISEQKSSSFLQVNSSSKYYVGLCDSLPDCREADTFAVYGKS